MIGDDYFYLTEFIYGPEGDQPHNFILLNGESLNITSKSFPDGGNFDWYNETSIIERTFENLTRKDNLTRNYEELTRKDIVINTKGAEFEIISLKKELPTTIEPFNVSYFLLVPYKYEPNYQIINFDTLGKTKYQFFIELVFVLTFLIIFLLRCI